MIIFLGAAEFYSGNLWVGTVFLTAVDRSADLDTDLDVLRFR